MNHRLVVPVNALLLQVTVPAILGLIYLGSDVIFFAFFQLTTIGYLISVRCVPSRFPPVRSISDKRIDVHRFLRMQYFIPIALVFFRGRHLLPPAYWRLPGGLARFCNIVSLLYIPFICVLFCIPNFYPVTSTNMNCESAPSCLSPRLPRASS